MSDQSYKPPSIFDGAKYLYAEQLAGRTEVFTITGVRPTTIVGTNGREDFGFEMAFKETAKLMVFSSMECRRRLALLFGTDDYSQYVGKRIGLYPAKSARSVSGQAIRFCEAVESDRDPHDMADAPPPAVTAEQLARLESAIMDCPAGTEAGMLKWAGVGTLADFPARLFAEAWKILEKKVTGK